MCTGSTYSNEPTKRALTKRDRIAVVPVVVVSMLRPSEPGIKGEKINSIFDYDRYVMGYIFFGSLEGGKIMLFKFKIEREKGEFLKYNHRGYRHAQTTIPIRTTTTTTTVTTVV